MSIILCFFHLIIHSIGQKWSEIVDAEEVGSEKCYELKDKKKNPESLSLLFLSIMIKRDEINWIFHTIFKTSFSKFLKKKKRELDVPIFKNK